MTERPAPLTDEDLSALLDGEAAPGVAERVAADPRAQARLAELQAASTALGDAPVAGLEPSVVDQLVGRALAAADERPADGVVAPLRPKRARPGGAPPWLVAAAVALLVGVGLVLVWSGRDDPSTQQATVARDVEQPTAKDAGSGASERADSDTATAAGGSTESQASATTPEVAPHGVPTTALSADADAVATDLARLGTFATADELREDLKDGFDPGLPPYAADEDARSVLTNASVSRCDTVVRTMLSIEGQVRRRGVATVDGEQVLVYEYGYTTPEDPDATTLVVGVGSAACNRVLGFVR